LASLSFDGNPKPTCLLQVLPYRRATHPKSNTERLTGPELSVRKRGEDLLE
jgi:hypothetical protein